MSQSPDVSPDDFAEAGNNAADAGDFEKSIGFFLKAINLGATWCRRNLGNSYSALGLWGAAEEAFRDAWSEGDVDAGFNYARSLEAQGKIREARSVFHELIQAGDKKAMDQEAIYLREEGELSRARELMSRAAEGEGVGSDRAASILGVWIWDDLADSSAAELVRRGYKYNSDARDVLAEILSTQGNFDGAAEIRKQIELPWPEY